MAEERLVRREAERGIATLTLDSPGNRNALSARLRADLADGLAGAMADDDVRAVVLTASGSVFCAGADLKEVAAQRAGNTPEPADAPAIADLLSAIMDSPKPVIALLNGSARAGGIGLVAAADIAIAPRDATFAFTEVRIGVVPAVISVPVMARMHDRQLNRYFLTGETFDAVAAAEAGLVTCAVPSDELAQTSERILEGVRGAAPRALTRTKELLGGSSSGTRRAAFVEMTKLSSEFFDSEDAVEGRAAFFEKRPPRWAE